MLTAGTNLQYAEGTFVLPLLPYLEGNVVYTNYMQYLNGLLSSSATANQLTALNQSQVYMANLICPSNPPTSTSGSTPLAYIINGGQIDSGGNPGSAASGRLHRCIGAAIGGGRFGHRLRPNRSHRCDNLPRQVQPVKVNQDYVNSHDGTSYTLLLSETTSSNTSWSLLTTNTASTTPGLAAGYQPASSGKNGSPISNSSYGSGPFLQQVLTTFMWANSGGVSSVSTPPTISSVVFQPINGDKTNTGAIDLPHARPASNHPGICVFAFCGGNVRTISEDIDYRVYKQLMTPFGGSSTTSPCDHRLRRL